MVKESIIKKMEIIYNFELHKDYENECKALHGDVVIEEDSKIIEIKTRQKHKLAGVLLCDSKMKYGLYKNKLLYLFKPHNRNYPDFYVPSKYKNDIHKKYTYIEFLEWKSTSKCPIGIVLDYIGNVGDKSAEYHYLRYVNNIQHIKECKMDKNKYENDKNLHQSIQNQNCKYHVFSIDPIGCTDIDDAFHYKYNIEDNSYEVGVHISYVWKYFEKSEFYFNLFSERVSTLYMNEKNINMIPKEYSNQLGSLLEKQNKFVLSVVFKIVENKIVSYEISQHIVYVMKNYDYDSVDSILKKTNDLSKKESMLCDFMNLTKKVFDNVSIEDSHKLVEYWMIYANCTMANECIKRFSNKTLLRVQNKDQNKDKDKEEDKNKSNMDSTLNQFLDIYRGNSAIYTLYDENKDLENKHYNICQIFPDHYYTHYTSPIRRFCDMYIHALFMNTLPNEIDLEHMVTNMNVISKAYRKFYNQSKMIDLIYKYIDSEEYVIESNGYIMELNETSYKIYFPEYGFVLKNNYVIKQLENISYIEKVDVLNDSLLHSETQRVLRSEEINKVKVSCEESSVIYELYKKYDFLLYLFPKKYMLHERILIKRK